MKVTLNFAWIWLRVEILLSYPWFPVSFIQLNIYACESIALNDLKTLCLTHIEYSFIPCTPFSLRNTNTIFSSILGSFLHSPSEFTDITPHGRDTAFYYFYKFNNEALWQVDIVNIVFFWRQNYLSTTKKKVIYYCFLRAIA